jgi:ribosomal protein L14
MWQLCRLHTLTIADNCGINFVKIISRQHRIGRRQKGRGGGLHKLRAQVGMFVTGAEVKRLRTSLRSSVAVSVGARASKGGRDLVTTQTPMEGGALKSKDGATQRTGSRKRSSVGSRWPVHVVIVTQRQQINRNNGFMIKYGETRGLVVDVKTKKPRGSRILTPIAKDLRRVGTGDRVSLRDQVKVYC